MIRQLKNLYPTILFLSIFCSCNNTERPFYSDETELENAQVHFNITNHGIGHVNGAWIMTPNGTMAPPRHGYFEIDTVTDTIPARRGVQFGIDYNISASENDQIALKEIWIFPGPMYVKDSGKKVRRIVDSFTAPLNRNTYTWYRLDSDYEVMKGVWKLRFYYKHQMLVNKNFVLR